MATIASKMQPSSSPRLNSSSARAPLMRRQSSQSSQTSKHGVQSPGSGEQPHPLRHAVKPARRTKIVLPRNHSSARDLAKLGRQALAQNRHPSEEDARKTLRSKSHEYDTEIRLPGSLDDAKAPPIRRNLTAYQLPRNTSHAKLKKNLSHGQLNRIGSGKNLAGLNATALKGPPSPRLKNRKKARSADATTISREMDGQEAEMAQEDQEKPEGQKKVGFAVGSSGDSEREDEPQMEGSGMQEDEWTDQSASASPYSTRQNTANNSRRASIIAERLPDRRPVTSSNDVKRDALLHHARQQVASESKTEADSTLAPSYESEESDEDDEATSPRSMPHVKKRGEVEILQLPHPTSASKAPQRSPLHGAKEHPNPATRHLLTRQNQSPAPALVSNVSALDDLHIVRGSPAPSITSSRSNPAGSTADQDQDELVSRFIPSTSHPSNGSGGNTTMNTPKTGSFQTPENESTLAAQHRDKPTTGFQPGPVSPGSTVSGSSGAATPAMARSRTELRMMNEKMIAEMEDAAARNPMVPPHVYDRRNETLKSYLNLSSFGGDGRGAISSTSHLTLGPEIFQGRFKAVNTELKVVQKFRDPIAESVGRLQRSKGTKSAHFRGQKASSQNQSTRMPISKSAVQLGKQPSKLSTSMSPPKSAGPVKPAMSSTKSTAQAKGSDSRRGKVTFSQTPPETRQVERTEEEGGADAIAKQLWDSGIA